jgi:hypothetical protein
MAKAGMYTGVAIMAIALAVAGCKPGVSPMISEAATANAQSAPWLNQMIQQMQEEQTANPPAKVFRYTYKDQQVYYVTGRCCDVPGRVYDMYGNVICEPDGGITGRGDGRCPDFFEERKDETLIWEDKRES